MILNKSDEINEIWKPVKGYEGIYEVSNLGRVKSLPRLKYCGHKNSKPQKVHERILTSHVDRLGYVKVRLSKNGESKTSLLHRVIAEAFIDPVEGKSEINHKDGVKANNAIENLEWSTRSENVKHAFLNKLKHPKRAEENNKSKLNWDSVNEIRDLHLGGVSQKDLSIKFGVTIASINNIINYKTWKVGS